MSDDDVVPIARPDLGPEVENLVIQVLRSGRLAQGPMVERFERLCCVMAGTEFAVAMANGTVTLEAALEVLDVGPGDEVITSPLTFAATVNSIVRTGATARFADVTGDFTIDPDGVRALVGPRTAVLMPVHLYGLMAEIQPLAELAARHSLGVVEDAAQAHGARCDGVLAGATGLGSFSFYATKNVTAGEGGVVTTSDPQHDQRLRVLRNQGMRSHYSYEAVGRNLRMTEVHAAVAIPQLERLEEINQRRRRNAEFLVEALSNSGLELPIVPQGRDHVWHQFTVLLPPGAVRTGFVDEMARRRVTAGIYYPTLVWQQPAYESHPQVRPDETPRAADIATRCVSLPVHPSLSSEQLERVAEAANAALARAGGA